MDFDALMPNLDILGNIVGFYGYDEPTHGMFSSSGHGGWPNLEQISILWVMVLLLFASYEPVGLGFC